LPDSELSVILFYRRWSKWTLLKQAG